MTDFNFDSTSPNQPSQVAAVSHIFLEADNNLRFVIGRYIHDYPQQRIQRAISLVQESQQWLQSEGGVSLAQYLSLLQNLLDLLNQADKSLSATRHQLMPIDLQKGRFQMGLEDYILDDFLTLHPDVKIEIIYQLNVLGQLYDQTELEDNETALAQKMILALFLREALENTYKHSAATQVVIESKLMPVCRLTSMLAGLDVQIPLTHDTYLCLSVQNNGLEIPNARPGSLPLRANGTPSSFHEFELRARSIGGFTLLNPTDQPGTTWQLYLATA